MARKIIFSTGNMYKVHKNIHKMIDESLKLDIDGIEILFPNASVLLKFKFKKEQLRKLKKLKYNTLHLPFYKTKRKNRIFFYNNIYSRKVLEKAYKIAKQINAINLNMHAHQLKNPKVLRGLDDIGYTFENMTKRHKFRLKDYEKLLKKNPKFNMLLDISHGLMTNQLEILVSKFKDKIKFIHLSGSRGLEDDHILLHRFNHPNKKRIDIIKKLDCYIVIEAGREKDLTLNDFNKEIYYVRKWLKY